VYCPNCGADNQTADSYCKRCGEWLTDFKKGSLASFGGQTPQQNIFTGLFMSALSAVGALLSAIALYATYLGTDEAKWSVYLAGGFCVCIAGWQLSSFIVGLKLRSRLNHAQTRGEDKAQLKTTNLRHLHVGVVVDFNRDRYLGHLDLQTKPAFGCQAVRTVWKRRKL
jgi:hypothetical protein